MQTAVRYEIEKHNNSTSTVFRLDRYEKAVDAADSFDVCKACELCSLFVPGCPVYPADPDLEFDYFAPGGYEVLR